MELKNRFKELDLVDRVPEELWMEARNKNHPKEKEMQESKVAVLRGLTNSREEKGNEREIGKATENGMQTSREQQGEIRGPFYMNSAKK